MCVCEEEAEKVMTTGWSLPVNGSDSEIERERVEKKKRKEKRE